MDLYSHGMTKEVRSALTSLPSFHLLHSLPINVSQRCTVKIGSYYRPNKSNLQREHLAGEPHDVISNQVKEMRNLSKLALSWNESMVWR